jgi:hypothetical protein
MSAKALSTLADIQTTMLLDSYERVSNSLFIVSEYTHREGCLMRGAVCLVRSPHGARSRGAVRSGGPAGWALVVKPGREGVW